MIAYSAHQNNGASLALIALPELTLPEGFPDFKTDTYEYTPGSFYKAVDRAGGAPRRRALHLNPPPTVKAELELSQEQIEEFFLWHEGPLRAGERPFTARVPKFGAGVAYQEARCLGFQVEHREGINNHLLTLTLRLKGEPQNSPPVIRPLAAEVFVGIYSDFVNRGLPDVLSAEVFLALTGDLVEPAMLAANVFVPLLTEFAGPAPDGLAAEVAVGLFLVESVIPSASFSAEVGVALDLTAKGQASLEASVAVSLGGSFSGSTGFVAAPPDINYTVSRQYFPYRWAAFTVEVGQDGAINTRVNTEGFVEHALWHDPKTEGIGTGLWVRANKIAPAGAGISETGDSYGTWHSLTTSGRSWRSYVPGYSSLAVQNFNLEVAADPDGATILSALEVTLTFNITP